MIGRLLPAAWLAVLIICSRSLHAQQPFFMGIGDLPGGAVWSQVTGISADGRILVGNSSSAAHDREAFRWTPETGMVGLGAVGARSNATRISDDGSTIIGETGDPLGATRAYRWKAGAGMTLLPVEMSDNPRGINGDGSIIVSSTHWWSASLGVQLPMAPMTNLYEVSSDGATFIGYISGGRGYAWSAETGLIDLAPAPPAILSDPPHISADGKVILGAGLGGPFRWTKETGAVSLAVPMPGGAVPTSANGLSADGSIVVGGARGGSDIGAYIWDSTHGARNLKQVLIDEYGLGASVAGWDMRTAYAISADGRTIVGGSNAVPGAITGDLNPQGQQEAWIAYLGPAPVPEPTGASLLLCGLALASLASRRRRDGQA